MPNFSERFARVELLLPELVEDRQHVARRHRDDVGLEIVDQLHLPFGHAAGHRHHGAAELFGAVMRAEPAGEQAVAIGVVHDHAGAAAGGADRARHHLGPDVDIGLGIADHDRLARRAGRGMDADHFLARDREHVEGIIVAQVGFHRERKFREIGKLLQIARMHAGLVEGLLVVGDIVVGMRQRPGEAFGLQRHDLVAGSALGRIHFGAVAACPGLKDCRSHRAFPPKRFLLFRLSLFDGRSDLRQPRAADGAGMTAKFRDHFIA